MATFTPKHGLRQPEYTDVENVDLDVNFNMQRIDARMNYAPCTSLTRPTGVPDGQLIYETDTGDVLIKIGSSWKVLANDKFPKGKKGLTTSTANGSTVTTGDFVHLSTTFTAETGRKYLAEVHYFQEMVTLPLVSLGIVGALRWATGGAVTASDNLIVSTFNNNQVTQIADFYRFGEFFPNVNGNVTVGLILSKAAGTEQWRRHGSSVRRNYLSVKDWGI